MSEPKKTKTFHHKHSKQNRDLCSGQQQQKCSESITADCVLDVISALIFNGMSPYM